MKPYVEPRGRKNNYERGPTIAAAREQFRTNNPALAKLIDKVAAAVKHFEPSAKDAHRR